MLTDLDALVDPYRPGYTDVRLHDDQNGPLGTGPAGLDLRVDAEIHDQMGDADRRELERIAERAESLTPGRVELVTG